MVDVTTHLTVIEALSEENADVTVKGEPEAIAEAMERIDLDTLLQRELEDLEEDSDLDVEVVPQKGLAGLAADIKEKEDN